MMLLHFTLSCHHSVQMMYLPCFDHTLNLAVKAGLAIPRVQKVVSKCSNIVVVSVTSTSESEDSGPPRKKTKSSAEAVRTILADMFQQSTNNTKEREPQDVAESELVSYLREKPVSVNSNSKENKTDPLEWWKDNSFRYKLLSTLAAKYLCVPATSVPSESFQLYWEHSKL